MLPVAVPALPAGKAAGSHSMRPTSTGSARHDLLGALLRIGTEPEGIARRRERHRQRFSPRARRNAPHSSSAPSPRFRLREAVETEEEAGRCARRARKRHHSRLHLEEAVSAAPTDSSSRRLHARQHPPAPRRRLKRPPQMRRLPAAPGPDLDPDRRRRRQHPLAPLIPLTPTTLPPSRLSRVRSLHRRRP